MLALAAFFSGAAIRLCDGLLPRLAADFAITPGEAGAVVIWFSLAYGLMQLVFGPLADRHGKARVICLALAACTVAAAACAFAPRFDVLVGLRVAWGIGAAGVIPLSMALIGDTVPIEERQATLATLLMGTLSGMMAGQLAGGLFADGALGWRGAFGAAAVGYLAVSVLLYVRLRASFAAPPATKSPGFIGPLRGVLSQPWSRWVLAGGFAEGVFLLGPLAYLPAFLHERFGLTLTVASALVALYAVGGLAYALTARHVVRRLGQVRMVVVGGWMMGAGYLAWALSPLAWTAAPVALLVGFGTYLYHNTLQTHATQMAPEARGSAVALFAFCLFMGQGIGVLATAWAHDHLGGWVPLLAAAVALPGVALAFGRALKARE
ncbi:MFS transporter [Ramlibacter rhizophilus]|uniref:MFS transporter n=1 Tax=Ramlibacter rhizophilus TaxID=1781167 RepID=A0A4Z0BS75_9BURK|nr:MFS transporter [Ramlibacter rhizophilus]